MRSFIGPGPGRLLGRIAGLLRSASTGALYWAIFGSIIVIAVVDSLTPLNLDEWLLFDIPLVLSFASLEPMLPIGTAIAATIAMVAGSVVSPAGFDLGIEITNRIMGVLALWATGGVGYFFIRNKLILSRTNEALQAEMIEREKYEEALQMELVARKTHQQVLQESKDNLQFALDAARVGWWQYDPVHNVVSWDTRSKEIFDVAEDNTDIEEFKRRVHPDDLGWVWAAVEAALDPTDPKPYEAEYRHRKADGEVRWVKAHGLVRFQGLGREQRALSMVGTAHDITERKKHEEKEHLLIREINHRAKNMLMVVDAIARQTAAANPEDFVERFSERVQALSVNQDLLVRNEWTGVEIEDLVGAQLAHFADLIGSRITIQGPKLRLNAAGAQAVGLALHELATNAGKYGALSVDTGRVDVRWTDGETFNMSWTEREGPPVSAPERRGFGTIVTKAMAEHSVNGTVLLDYTHSGVTWCLTCPAANALERGGLSEPNFKELSNGETRA